MHGMNPHASASPAIAWQSLNGNNVPNILEFLYGNDPHDPNATAPAGLDNDGDGFIDWLEMMLGTDPGNANSYPTMQMLKNSMKSKDMAYAIVNNVVVQLNASPNYPGLLKLCPGDCFRLHATGAATDWFILKGGNLVTIEADPTGCLGPLVCVKPNAPPGDVVIMSRTPGSPPIIGWVYIKVLVAEHPDCDGCELEIKLCDEGGDVPTCVNVDDELCFEAIGGENIDAPHVWEALASEYGAVQFTSMPGGPGVTQVWVKFLAPAEVTVSACKEDAELEVSCKGGVTLLVRTARLDVARVNGNYPSQNVVGYLANDRKESPGAFLPLNNDDDDYSATVCPANLGADYLQTGAIVGENDLLPIVLRAIEPIGSGGDYTLTIPSHVRVWQTADRSDAQPVDGSTTFPAHQETMLYVEGIAEGVGEIKLNWSDCAEVDSVKLTVFTWQGPLNVPGHAAYDYTASGALPLGPAGAGWTDATDGATFQSGQGTYDATILWESGPSISRAVFTVNEDYVWELEVNVVQVEINFEPGTPTGLSYNNPSVQDHPASPMIVSSVSGPAMSATVAVTVEGPAVSGVMRGTRFVEIGFIQNASFVFKHADFDFEHPPAPPPAPQRRVSSLEGTGWLLDYVTQPLPSVSPWYNSNGNGLVALGDLETPISVVLSVTDNPQLTATDEMTLKIPGLDVEDSVDRFAIVFDCNLYLAVRTTSAVNGSEVIYTQRGTSSWTFRGSGVIDAAHNWTSTVTPNNEGSATFSPVNSGAVVPVTTGTPVNDLFECQTWATVPQ